MQYIFEDSQTSLLSQLFRKGYSDEVIANFHYTNGNSKIVRYVTTTFKSTEDISIFLDMPPGNPHIVGIYEKICGLAKTYKRLVIYPLVCMEYYFLSAIRDSGLVTSKTWVDTCLSFGLASDTYPPIIDTDAEERGYTTYENFCKLVARKALVQCARIGVLSKSEDRFRPFFSGDCLCKTDLVFTECKPWLVKDKAVVFIRQLPTRPAFRDIPGERIATWEERVDIHKHLVDAYNNLSKFMCERDKMHSEAYLRIDPIFH